jgi:hypothetical protein
MLSIERERLYIMYIERESLKEQVETFLNLSLSFTHTKQAKTFLFLSQLSTNKVSAATRLPDV